MLTLLLRRWLNMAEIPSLICFALLVLSGWYSLISRQQQAALRASNQQLQAILENSPVVVYLKDVQGRYILINRQFENLFHVSKKDVIGKTDYEIFSKDFADKFRANDQKVLTDLNPLEFEEVAPHQDGLHSYFSVKFPLYNSAGIADAICGISTDITRRKQAEDAVRQAQYELERRVEERTAQLAKINAELQHQIIQRQQVEDTLLIKNEVLEQMPEAVIVTDLEGKIQKWLGSAEDIFGYTDQEVIGKQVKFLYRSDIQEEINALVIQEMETSGLFVGEIACIKKNKSEVPIETTAKKVYEKTGKPVCFVGIYRDITERKQAELERSQLMRAQAISVISETAEQSSAFLAEVSAVLASSLDYDTTLNSVAQLIVPFLADWCAIDIYDQTTHSIRRVAVAHQDPSKIAFAWQLNQLYPEHPDAPNGVPKVLRTGLSEIAYEIPDAGLVNTAQDAEHLRILRELGLKSAIVVPLIARGRSLGVISLITAESDRRYTDTDLSLTEELARRAAFAVDNARLYTEAQQARQIAEIAADRTARLQKVTAALSESLTPSQVAEVIVEQGMAAFGANSALVVLLTQDGSQLEIIRAVGYKPELLESWRYFSIHEPYPLSEAVRTGIAVWAECKAERIAQYPHLAEVYAHYEHEAWVSMPLMVDGRAIGGVTLNFKEPQKFNEEDRIFMLTLAQQCAQAIARAYLYEAEKAARSTAETASRMKDEFLAVLSHELRTPLNSMLGWSKLLRSRKFDEATTARALETIERNAQLQSQLIEDILDVSRIIRGKLRLNIRPVNLLPVIESAIDAVRPAANAKAIQLELVPNDSIGLVSADSDRLQQVLWNLLSNAIKFTPDGGKVKVQLDSTDSQVQIQVIDTGKGISPEFLPYVFERFSQADSTTTRSYGGLGLGLAIVRHLVELHGGTVKADSLGDGQGATFTIYIPLLQASREVEKHPNNAEKNSATLSALTQENSLLSGLKILVVDDSADTLAYLTAAIEQYGAKVEAIASVSEAIIALKNLHPDVLISDIGMPDQDGYDLIKQVRSLEQLGQIPAMALTAYAREEDRTRALSAGFQMYLSKPVEPDKLASAIAQLVGRNIPISSQIS
jgi:PAS domain S-box-containing protein